MIKITYICLLLSLVFSQYNYDLSRFANMNPFDYTYDRIFPASQYSNFATALNNNQASRLYQLGNGMNVNTPAAVGNIRQALNNEINRVVGNQQRKIDSYNPIFMNSLFY